MSLWYNANDMRDTMFSRRLKQLLSEHNLTVSELARRTGVVDNTIRQLVLGNSEGPSFKLGLALAQAFGVHPEELLCEKEVVPQETLVDRVDRLESLVSAQEAAPQDSRQTREILEGRMEKIEAVVGKMLQAQGIHQKELEVVRAELIRRSDESRRAGKPLLPARRATRKA